MKPNKKKPGGQDGNDNAYIKDRSKVRLRWGSFTLAQSTISFLNRWCGAYSSVSRGIDGLVNVVESLIGEKRLAVRVTDLIYWLNRYPLSGEITLTEILQFFAKEKNDDNSTAKPE